MGRGQHNPRRSSILVGLLPALSAQAPAIAFFQPRECVHRIRSRQVVANRLRIHQEFISHFRTDQMQSLILTPGPAATITKETRHWIRRTGFEVRSEHVLGLSCHVLFLGIWLEMGICRVISILTGGSVILSPRLGDEESSNRIAPRNPYWAMVTVLGQNAKVAEGRRRRASAGSARPRH